MQERYERDKQQVEQALLQAIARDEHVLNGLWEVMEYSLMAGGKRIRPVLVLEFCRAAGGQPEAALPAACAVEMLHTYSLIHDDLPCMDDDDLRRGRPTSHVKFGEWKALLAGDALQAEALRILLCSEMAADRRAACAALLARAAGVQGICGGQYLDLEGEGQSLSQAQLTEIHRRKTCSLLSAACQMGVAAAGGNEAMQEAADRYGQALGMAFQIRDDMLDELGNQGKLGKPVGSDRAEGKTTFLTLYGPERCQALVEQLTAEAKEYAARFDDGGFLSWLADQLAVRES